MRFRLVLLLLVVVLSLLTGLAANRKPNEDSYGEDITEDNAILFDKNLLTVNRSFDLNSDGKEEKLNIKSYLGLPGEERTEIYLNDEIKPTLLLYGFFDNVLTHDINGSKHKVLELQVASGHSINTLIYKYQEGKLVRIPISTENAPYFTGIVSRNSPQFEDIDGDGILEMLVYSRYFPPRSQRQIEVYKFVSNSFVKTASFKEALSETYY